MAKEFWGKVRGDIQKGYKDSLSFLKSKTEELTEESKKKYKIYEHKHKAHKQIAELGAKVYEIVNTGGSVDNSRIVKDTVEKIKKIEELIDKLEALAKKKSAKSTKPTKPTKKKAIAKKKAAVKKKAPAKKKAPVKKKPADN